MNHPLIQAFIDSGPVSQGIMLVLLILSITAWSIIIEKLFFFRKLNRNAQIFLDHFRDNAKSLIGADEMTGYKNESLIHRIYEIGNRELALLRKDQTEKSVSKSQQDDLEHALKREISKQAQFLEKNMIILATSASISPFLGLLGTVYGLLIAFYAMGQMGSASIEVVSPGISQALMTTVVGLFVAIPSAVGYNYLLNTIKNLIIDTENYMSEFLSLVEKGHFR